MIEAHQEDYENTLNKGDVCLLHYEDKIKSTCRLCIVLELIFSEEDLVCTVQVGYSPR